VSDLLSAVALVVALVALWLGYLAYRRDRADVRVVEGDAGAGQRYITIVNVGRQPVRFRRVLERRSQWPWSTVDITHWAIGKNEPTPWDSLDLVMQPSDEHTLHIPSPEIRQGGVGPLYLEDAAGRRHRVASRASDRIAPDK
jgi:hypothetical protein